MEKIKHDRRNPRFKVGQFHQHKKHGFVIQLVGKGRWGKWVFTVIKGDMPNSCRPDYVNDKFDRLGALMAGIKPNEATYAYSRDNLFANFICISGAGAEVLFGTRKGE